MPIPKLAYAFVTETLGIPSSARIRRTYETTEKRLIDAIAATALHVSQLTRGRLAADVETTRTAINSAQNRQEGIAAYQKGLAMLKARLKQVLCFAQRGWEFEARFGEVRARLEALLTVFSPQELLSIEQLLDTARQAAYRLDNREESYDPLFRHLEDATGILEEVQRRDAGPRKAAEPRKEPDDPRLKEWTAKHLEDLLGQARGLLQTLPPMGVSQEKEDEMAASIQTAVMQAKAGEQRRACGELGRVIEQCLKATKLYFDYVALLAELDSVNSQHERRPSERACIEAAQRDAGAAAETGDLERAIGCIDAALRDARDGVDTDRLLRFLLDVLEAAEGHPDSAPFSGDIEYLQNELRLMGGMVADDRGVSPGAIFGHLDRLYERLCQLSFRMGPTYYAPEEAIPGLRPGSGIFDDLLDQARKRLAALPPVGVTEVQKLEMAASVEEAIERAKAGVPQQACDLLEGVIARCREAEKLYAAFQSALAKVDGAMSEAEGTRTSQKAWIAWAMEAAVRLAHAGQLQEANERLGSLLETVRRGVDAQNLLRYLEGDLLPAAKLDRHSDKFSEDIRRIEVRLAQLPAMAGEPGRLDTVTSTLDLLYEDLLQLRTRQAFEPDHGQDSLQDPPAQKAPEARPVATGYPEALAKVHEALGRNKGVMRKCEVALVDEQIAVATDCHERGLVEDAIEILVEAFGYARRNAVGRQGLFRFLFFQVRAAKAHPLAQAFSKDIDRVAASLEQLKKAMDAGQPRQAVYQDLDQASVQVRELREWMRRQRDLVDQQEALKELLKKIVSLAPADFMRTIDQQLDHIRERRREADELAARRAYDEAAKSLALATACARETVELRRQHDARGPTG